MSNLAQQSRNIKYKHLEDCYGINSKNVYFQFIIQYLFYFVFGFFR